MFIRSHFKPSGKKNSLCTPLPFGNLSFLDPPTPRKFRDPPWGGGYGYFLEPHNATFYIKQNFSNITLTAKFSHCAIAVTLQAGGYCLVYCLLLFIWYLPWEGGFTWQPCCMTGTIESFSYGKNVLSNATHFHCSHHVTWLPCKTSVPTTLRPV